MADFDALKAKYNSVFEVGESVALNIQNLNPQDDKIYVKGVVPSNHAKNVIWDEIKRVNPAYDDIIADINVEATKYRVQAGESLSKIAKHVYGDANHYHAIFNANTDILSDPDKIQPGQELTLPAA